MTYPEKSPGPFYQAAGTTGVLLLHGLSGSAYVFEQLVGDLAEDGFTAYAPLLAGHGTIPEDLAATTTEDWISSAEAAYDQLRQTCDTIYVLGVSFGGLIAGSLSLRRPVAGIVMIGTPLAFEHQSLIRLATIVFPLIGRQFYEKGSTRIGVRYYEKSGNDLHIGNEIFAGANYSYRKMPISSVKHTLRYLPVVSREILPAISSPVLVIHSKDDGLIKAGGGELLFKRLGSAQKQLVWSTRPHHRLRDMLSDPEVYGEIRGFLRPS